MAGPNPYPVHSFLELRKVMGRSYVVCRHCRRFVPVGGWLDPRDTRTTTFSCSVCGGDGDLVFEDPAKEGLQHDPRPNAIRHQLAALRLRSLHALNDPFGHKAVRETLPQRPRPYLESMPRFQLVPLPIRTFRQAFDFGLMLRIHCPRCHDWRPIDLATEHLDRPFAFTRFVCRHLKLKVYGEGREICGGPGELVFEPAAGRDPNRTFVDMQCVGAARGGPHTGWEINGVDFQAPPWAGLLDTSRQRFSCPGCRGMARHTFHKPYPHKPSTPVPPADTTPTS